MSNVLTPDDATFEKWVNILRDDSKPDILRDECDLNILIAYKHARLALRYATEEVERLKALRPQLQVIDGGAQWER